MNWFVRIQLGKRSFKGDLTRFCIVGCLGFAINLVFLYLFYKQLGFPIFVAQIIGSEVALFNNFLLHHYWTYQGHDVKKSFKRLLIEFHATSWTAILGSAIIVSIGVKVFQLNYFVALIFASIIALAWNFAWSRHYIWQRKDPKQE